MSQKLRVQSKSIFRAFLKTPDVHCPLCLNKVVRIFVKKLSFVPLHKKNMGAYLKIFYVFCFLCVLKTTYGEPLVDIDPIENKPKSKPQLDLSDFSKSKDLDDITIGLHKVIRKGKTLQMYVFMSGNPSPDEAKEVSGIWQLALWNAHILEVDRYLIQDKKGKVEKIGFVFKVL